MKSQKLYTASLHSMEESLNNGTALRLFYSSVPQKGRAAEIRTQCKNQGVPTQRISDKEIDQYAAGKHRGIVMEILSSARKVEKAQDYQTWITQVASEDSLLVFLDGITDPHNLGAVLRSADIFAVDAVVLPARRSVKITPTVMSTSSGAAQYVQVFTVTNINNAIELAQKNNFWVHGAAMEGVPASKTDLTGRIGLVMGSEGAGLHQHTASLCDQLISIPMRGHVDSLNVSAAAAVLMYEIRRQQSWA